MDENLTPIVVNSPELAGSQTPQTAESIVTVATPEGTVPEQPKKKGRLMLPIVLIIVFLAVLIIGGGAALAYGITYKNIDIGNSKIQKSVSGFVLSLPFTPKTPEYLLVSSLEAHKKVTMNNFDISLAVSSSQGNPILSQLGYSDFDLAVVGKSDYSDMNNIKIEGNVALRKDTSVDFIFLNKTFYFKINSIPSIVYTFLGIDQESLSPLFNRWVSYDSSGLESEARSLVNEVQTKRSEEQKYADEFYDKLLESGFFDDVIVQQEVYEDEEIYKLSGVFTEEKFRTLQNILNEIDPSRATDSIDASSYLDEAVNVEILMGKQDMLIRKMSISTSLTTGDRAQNNEAQFGGVQPDYFSYSPDIYDVAFVLKLSDFDSPFVVTAPSGSVTSEEYLESILGVIQNIDPETSPGLLGLVNPGRQFSQARDTQRRSDLLSITNAIYQYAAEHNGELPGSANFPDELTCIGTDPSCFNLGAMGGTERIVPTYIAAIPFDPSSGTDGDTGYKIYIDSNGRISATATGELTPEITVVR